MNWFRGIFIDFAIKKKKALYCQGNLENIVLKLKKDIFVVLFFTVLESLICYFLPCISQVGEMGWPGGGDFQQTSDFLIWQNVSRSSIA